MQETEERVGRFWGFSDRWATIALIALAGFFLLLMFWPLIRWLTHSSIHIGQLNTGGLLVLAAVLLCLRDTVSELRLQPSINDQGIAFVTIAFAFLWLAARLPALSLPLVMTAFCLALAAVISFLFGRLGVRRFLPALAGIGLFGLLVALFPRLDWPLRKTAADYAFRLLSRMGVPVEQGLAPGRPAELLLTTGGRTFLVATECNGFGLLSSSLLVSVMLGFPYHLPWMQRVGLVVFAVPAALAFNAFRIIAICLTAPNVRLPYALIHEGYGLFFFAACLLLIWWLARFAAYR